MKLNKIQAVKKLAGQRALLRLDLNIPLGANGRVDSVEAWRINRVLVTINYLIQKKTKIIIVAHLGRPEGRVVKSLSLAPVADYLGTLLKKKIVLWSHDFEADYKKSLALAPGQVAMLENIRWHPGEQKNSDVLARRLARLADIYVNDAFANLHRGDTSMLAISKFLPSYAGLLLQEELDHLSPILKTRSSLAIILGGAKIASKIKLIKKFAQRPQRASVLLGGALANTMLRARGYMVGKSLVDKVAIARKLKSRNIFLPVDAIVSKNLSAKTSRLVKIDDIKNDDYIADLGPLTIRRYLSVLRSKKIIVWNGPLGYFENKRFMKASQSLAGVLSKLKATTIIGGGETVTMINQLKLQDKFSFVSTGGGAMLSFLQGDKLPALEVLIK